MDDSQATDDKFLQAMGLAGLDGDAKEQALQNILYTLNMRVGERTADRLTEEQATEFEQFDENTPNEEIIAWLDKNVPNRMQLIESEAQHMHAKAQADVARAMKLMNPTEEVE
jgi:hypothetical protein